MPEARQSTVEYRLTWRREGRQRSTRIYQTLEAAHRKARGILALEEVKAETSMDTMPDLVEPPVIEERPVGAWSESRWQPHPPTDGDRDGMRSYFPPRESGSHGDSGVPYEDGVPF